MNRLSSVLVGLYIALGCYSSALFAMIPDEITIGVLAVRDKSVVNQRWGALADLLNEKSDTYSFKVKAYYFDELESAVANRNVAYILANPSFYLYLQEIYGLSSPILTMINRSPDGQLVKSFGGVVFTQADNSELIDLKGLQNKKVAIVSPFSLGGYQMQAYALEDKLSGATDSLQLVELGMSQDQVVKRVLSGAVDAGFVRTGVLEQMVVEGRLSLEQIKVINQQSLASFPFISSTTLYPEWPFAALPYIDNDVTKYVVAELLKLTPADRSSMAMKIGGFDIPANYSSISHLLRTQRFPPFEQDLPISLVDIWAQYKLSIVLAIALLLSLVISYLFLLRNHRKLADTQHELSIERGRLEEVIWATSIGTWVWDFTTEEVQLNERWAGMLGYKLAELMPTTIETWRSLVHPDDLAQVEEVLHKHLMGSSAHFQYELRMKHKSGRWVWILTQGTVVERDRQGNPRRVSGFHMDIDSRKSREVEKEAYSQRLEVLATKDSLTYLYNRRSFLDVGYRLFDQAKENNEALSFLMIDADHFKRINDQYGHHAGDQVLKGIASFLEKNIRQGDLLARLGGEEFGILMPSTEQNTALAIADRIAAHAKREVVYIEEHVLHFNLSVGVAGRTDEIETLSKLMAEADKALYEVKATGRGFAKISSKDLD